MVFPQEPDFSVWDAIALGVVEGITEFLPVSSTGHLILASEMLDVHSSTFEVAIQGGAITAILFLYRDRLIQAFRGLVGRQRGEPGETGGTNLLVLLLVAALPAAVMGLLFEDVIDRYLFNSGTVVTTLILGGVLLIGLEGWLRHEKRVGIVLREMEAMTVRHAFIIGLFQCLALVPGTSRAAATIAGALILGFTRTAAAEFSFLVGLPILYGACLLKVVSRIDEVTGPMLPAILVATAVSFVSAALIVKPFVHFLRHHTFLPFGIYRIAVGLGLGVVWLTGWLTGPG